MLTNDATFQRRCSNDVVWIDVENLSTALKPGNRIFIDDGLISVVVTETGKSHEVLMGCVKNCKCIGCPAEVLVVD